MYNREAINILLWKAEMPCLNVWGVSQASQLCDRCHMSPELCTTVYKHQERKRDNGEDLDQLPTNSQPVRLSLVTSEVAQTQPTPTQPNPTAFPNRALWISDVQFCHFG